MSLIYVTGLLALFFNLDALAHMISAGTLLAYGMVAAGIVIMRFSLPEPSPDGGDGVTECMRTLIWR